MRFLFYFVIDHDNSILHVTGWTQVSSFTKENLLDLPVDDKNLFTDNNQIL